ncbi:alpha/beta-tubulin-N-acetyltransferase 9 isoform X2 [Peromyscus californicus insignis]|uniref:alpha/beta-tubulin-N-acetyltransferase 9 isoform X2 n=1 Tax=Peromyscus californicus insignis TaxID=564181 RepID=UPI0022A71E44|nr:alpha/beta-tubulin-N-acetyltransferase 9 isoform X2 [Peromyscus californicus insignis]
MRLNQNTVLLGKKVVLVPYTSKHVPRYHEWMQSEELRHLTASEPLTLEQEYAMQRSWREDEDKCTFIVLDAVKWQAQPRPPEESCMVGDVNLFLTDLEDPTLGEIEVMIAEGEPPKRTDSGDVLPCRGGAPSASLALRFSQELPVEGTGCSDCWEPCAFSHWPVPFPWAGQ